MRCLWMGGKMDGVVGVRLGVAEWGWGWQNGWVDGMGSRAIGLSSGVAEG